jgi:hypothetical protein
MGILVFPGFLFLHIKGCFERVISKLHPFFEKNKRLIKRGCELSAYRGNNVIDALCMVARGGRC